MQSNKRVCVVVPVHNRIDATLKFIENFRKVVDVNYRIVIVDDGSTDDTSEKVQNKYGDEVVILKGDGNLWWSGATNLGVKYAIDNAYDYVLTINNDSTVELDFLSGLVESAEQNPNTIIASRVMFPDKRKIWSIGVLVYFSAFPFLHLNKCNQEYTSNDFKNKLVETKALAGNGVLIPISIFNKIGFYEQNWCPQYHGDTEFSYRATLNGFKCLVCLDSVIYNNDFVADPKHSILDSFFSKKSNFYWRPVFWFYFKHAPLKYKLFFFKQFLWIPKRIVKKLIWKK